MVSTYPVLVLTGKGISNTCGKPPKSERSLKVARCCPTPVTVPSVVTPSAGLVPRPSQCRRVPAVHSACSIPSGRGTTCTPALMCNGRGCLVAERTEEGQDSRPQTGNSNSRRQKSRGGLCTPQRSNPIIADGCRPQLQQPYVLSSSDN